MFDNVYLLTRLHSLRDSSDKADGIIADFVITHMKNIRDYNISAIAELTNTSYATVCRFLKKSGLSGMKELKAFSAQLQSETEFDFNFDSFEYSYESYNEISFENILKKISNFSAAVTSNCAKIFTAEKLEEIVDALISANSIHFIGLGTSAVTAQYGYTKFFRLNTSCFFSTDVIISKMKTSLMKQSDILFAISSTGRTKSILEIAKLAKEIGIKVISICDFSDSPLSNISDIDINTTIRESNKFIDTDFPLIQAQITIIDILYACAYSKSHFASYNFNKTNKSVDSDKL